MSKQATHTPQAVAAARAILEEVHFQGVMKEIKNPANEEFLNRRAIELAGLVDRITDYPRLVAVNAELLEALKEFMDMWNSGDSTAKSKRAAQRRGEMWDKANAAVAHAEGKEQAR